MSLLCVLKFSLSLGLTWAALKAQYCISLESFRKGEDISIFFSSIQDGRSFSFDSVTLLWHAYCINVFVQIQHHLLIHSDRLYRQMWN